MHDAFFDVPLIVETSKPDEFRRLASVAQAAVFLMERWPEDHGPRYRTALRACTGRLQSRDDVENARRAFLSAAKEAGMVVKEESGDTDVEPRHDPEARPISVEDQRRRHRGRMEEEEEFLVRFLARETGITEAQARELINMIGVDRASLLEEARILKGRH